MDQKELLDKIRHSAEHIEVPESLTAQQMNCKKKMHRRKRHRQRVNRLRTVGQLQDIPRRTVRNSYMMP